MSGNNTDMFSEMPFSVENKIIICTYIFKLLKIFSRTFTIWMKYWNEKILFRKKEKTTTSLRVQLHSLLQEDSMSFHPW